MGLFLSGVTLSTGHGGLCFTPIKEMPAAVCCPSPAAAMPLLGKLRGRSTQAYLEGIFCGILVTRADEVLDILCEGGSGYRFFGKSTQRTLIRKRSGQ